MTDNWTRKQARTVERGVIFTLNGTADGVVVRRVTWAKPGFKNNVGSGWAIMVLGKQYGAAFPTATRAMRHAELPGVSAELDRRIADENDGDPEQEEILRDVLVAQTMEWAERGADPTDLAGILKATGDLRAWMAAHPEESE